MFSAAHDIWINGGTFVNNESSPAKTGLQLLHTYTAPGATHDSGERFPPPKCHPKTRREIVHRIVEWITNSTKEERVLWLNGPVGAGKSSIAQTLAELCLSLHNANTNTNGDITLAASFFFSRTAQRRNTEQFFFLTLAYQIGVVFPEAGKMISRIIEEDSSVMHKSPEVQFRKLVVEPLQRILRDTRTGRTGPVVIIIDGLDECSGEDMQCLILQLIGSVFESDSDLSLNPGNHEAQPKFPICFLIASRPESWIRDEFSTGTLAKVMKEISLSLVEALQVDEDIRTFYRSSLAEIRNSPRHRRTMASVPRPWPTDATIELLVGKACGQFQYASTVIKFVKDYQHRPTDRLDVILGLPTPHSSGSTAANAFAGLDRLYIQILSTCADRKRTCDVLGTIYAMFTAASNLCLSAPGFETLEVAEGLLGLRPGDADLALRTIHSLVHVRRPNADTGGSGLSSSLPPEDHQEFTLHEPTFRVYHKSFIEFLLDRARSGEYFIDMEMINGRLALRCLGLLTRGPPITQDAPGIEQVLEWSYALIHWTEHCIQSRPTTQIFQALAGFNLYSKYVITLDYALSIDEMEDIKQLEGQRTAPPSSFLSRFWAANSALTIDSSDEYRYFCAAYFTLADWARNDVTPRAYGRRLEQVADWVSWETGQFPSGSIEGERLVAGYRRVAKILKMASFRKYRRQLYLFGDEESLYPYERIRGFGLRGLGGLSKDLFRAEIHSWTSRHDKNPGPNT